MEKSIACIFSTVLLKDEYYHFAINLNDGYFSIWPHRQIRSPFEKKYFIQLHTYAYYCA